MKVEELVIDGFKSYSTRTVISNWDSQFNCITGLNGSGKSNILDAICFVLGITTLSTVRAQNLQDLIYKRGQAGITKASVTILFDNTDKDSSPIGFEDYQHLSVTRQIILGGTSKYLINGHRAQQQSVQQLFQSVQLNINNPNFLIMQGQITKVLNMKSNEILAMIEEAAGTRMFEDRWAKAQKTMAKKDKKMLEITALLQEEIEPKLDKLKSEKRNFLDFQQVQSNYERISKAIIAHDYLHYSQNLSQLKTKSFDNQSNLNQLSSLKQRLQSEISNIELYIKQLRQNVTQESSKGSNLETLELKAKELSHELVRLKTSYDLKLKTLAEEEEKIKSLQFLINEKTPQLAKKIKIFESEKLNFNNLKSQRDQIEKKFQNREELLQSLQTGISSREGQDGGYDGQLNILRENAQLALTSLEKAKLKLTHVQNRINITKPKAAQAEKANINSYKELERLKFEASKVEQQLKATGFEEGYEENLLSQESTLIDTIAKLNNESDNLKRRVSNIDFTYTNPTPNFDRSKVKGLVAQLFSLDKQNYNTSTALEICAGGRLYNVVVDTETTGTQLLKNGRLKRRVTIIPLNKISAFRASAERIASAKKIAPGKVDLALNLIGYDDEVSAAMEYVFASTLICEDAKTAKAVAFDPLVRLKSVTLEGDVYDPAGTLSGGSKPNSSGVLINIQKLNEITQNIKIKQNELNKLQNLLKEEGFKMKKVREIKNEYDLLMHKVSLTQSEIDANSSSLVIKELEDLCKESNELKESIIKFSDEEKKTKNEIHAIEKEIAEFKNDKTSKLHSIENEVKILKEKSNEINKIIKEQGYGYNEMEIEIDQLSGDIEALKEQFSELKVWIDEQNVELAKFKENQDKITLEHQEALESLENERSKLASYNDELKSLEDTKVDKKNELTEVGISLQKLENEHKTYKEKHKSYEHQILLLEEKYDWVKEERDNFGKKGTPFDYSQYNVNEAREQLKSLESKVNNMKKSINPKVMNMIGNVEKKETSLRHMYKTVLKDKRKIEEAIESLDEYKRKALLETWEKVNEDFGKIFNDLLPGNFAKLEPPENKDITEGLEIRVRLGQIWKQSLTELSGGQRSLIALSLILALLQFKPAPMYILDEVDAALDLSHTQNIGRIIKTHFKGSQFIVVSLKEGFFSNANRVFRAKFQDGTSTVTVM